MLGWPRRDNGSLLMGCRNGAAPTRAIKLLVLAAIVLCGCGGSETIGSHVSSGPVSIAQLGDSVASGEGTLYGYQYDARTQQWVGGNLDAEWPGPYPLCHTSPHAYGLRVATDLNGTLHQFACTGASYSDGITTPRVNKGFLGNTQLRPAEFGNWETRADLNTDYDAARPNLVMVTLGADDVQFVAIVEACIKNAYEHAAGLAGLDCTAGDPGSTITDDFTDYLPTLADHYKSLAGWIVARGKADGLVPKVVFTNYMEPLPSNGQKCPDSNWLYPDQIDYLATLVARLNTTIETTITGLHNSNVAVADISQVLNGHQWCSTDPWDYGLSIYKLSDPFSFESDAPFHPTPKGQQAIAALVAPVAKGLLGR